MSMIALMILGNILFNNTTKTASDYNHIIKPSITAARHSPGLEYTKLLHIQIINLSIFCIIYRSIYISFNHGFVFVF
jgi:hypothetical protein